MPAHQRDRAEDQLAKARPAFAQPAPARATEEIEEHAGEPRPQRDGQDHREQSQIAIVRRQAPDERRRLFPHDAHRAERDVRPHALEERHFPRLITRPARASVNLPPSTAATPFTKTKSIPTGYWCGSANVDRSAMVAASNTTTSAKLPARNTPRSLNRSRV